MRLGPAARIVPSLLCLVLTVSPVPAAGAEGLAEEDGAAVLAGAAVVPVRLFALPHPAPTSARVAIAPIGHGPLGGRATSRGILRKRLIGLLDAHEPRTFLGDGLLTSARSLAPAA